MKGYYIRPTKISPSIYFNPKNQLMDIRGKSCLENPLNFYNYIYGSIEKYTEGNMHQLTTNIAFEYFNTSSSKCIYVLLKKLACMHEEGYQVKINWYFEDGDMDMKEAGEDLNSFFNLEFNFITVPEIKVA